MEREIEVSQWGNVAIEEVVHARNSATPLTGEFSRRRSLWMVTGFIAIVLCVLVSLLLGYPGPAPTV